MFTQEHILKQLNQKSEELKQMFSVRSIGLFGSPARNEADSQSDVGIPVDFTETTFDHYMDYDAFEADRLRDITKCSIWKR
ncbi:MAG TPA: hypothetical protein HPP87_05355 [Planctomycetes bacterium]|nr:hypothetical protein [Planctomycetota bacterium]HIJ70776.1 hypothetical protein [Planctomycetota bacterium]